MENMNIEAMTDGELADLIDRARGELNRRDIIQDAKHEAEIAAERYREAVKNDPPRDYAPGDVIGPGDKVVENGVEFVNTSNAWLSVPPSAYPLGFERCESPADVADFIPGEDVKPGDLRRYDGVVYEVLQAHTTADHWPPTAAHSLWTRA